MRDNEKNRKIAMNLKKRKENSLMHRLEMLKKKMTDKKKKEEMKHSVDTKFEKAGKRILTKKLKDFSKDRIRDEQFLNFRDETNDIKIRKKSKNKKFDRMKKDDSDNEFELKF